jgi:hypothetical protein
LWANLPPPPQQQNPFEMPVGGFGGTGGGLGSAGAGAETFNPYQSPVHTPGYAVRQQHGPRSGPPWEREGASPGSFFTTIKEILLGAPTAFSNMRLDGGLGAPLGFAVIGGLIGAVANGIYQMILQSVFGAALGGGEAAALQAVGGLAGMGCALVIGPAVIVIFAFLASGVYHLMLMMAMPTARMAGGPPWRSSCPGSCAAWRL